MEKPPESTGARLRQGAAGVPGRRLGGHLGLGGRAGGGGLFAGRAGLHYCGAFGKGGERGGEGGWIWM